MAGLNDLKMKYGDRVLELTATEIVKYGLEAVKKNDQSGRAIEITVAAVANEIDALAWNDVRAIIKRCL